MTTSTEPYTGHPLWSKPLDDLPPITRALREHGFTAPNPTVDSALVMAHALMEAVHDLELRLAALEA